MTTNAAPAPNAAGISSRRNLQEGILLMVVGMLLPGIDAIAKGLSGSLSAGQVTWSRFAFQTLIPPPGPLVAVTRPAARRRDISVSVDDMEWLVHAAKACAVQGLSGSCAVGRTRTSTPI